MSNTTVAEFASELKKPTDLLIEQLKAAGVGKSLPTDTLTDGDKQQLLSHLKAAHGTATGERKKITLTKKIHQRNQASRRHGQGAHDSGGSAQEAHLRQARRGRSR